MPAFLKEVADDLVARFGDDLQNCAIVFNNNRPATYLRKYLAENIKKPFFSPSIYTIQQFFNESLKERPADFYLQFFTLLKVYNDLLLKEGLPQIETHRFFPLARIILSDFAQVDNDLVDPDKLYREMEDIAQIQLEFDYLTPEQHEFLSQFWQSYSEGQHRTQKQRFIELWRRMPKLYHGFHSELEKQNYITNGQAYRKLAELDVAELEFIKSFEKGKIIFVGFNALTRAEAKVFSKLQDAGKALFYFDTNSYYLDDELHEAGLFLRKNLGQFGLKNVFEDRSEPFANGQLVDVYKVQGQSAQAKILNRILGEQSNADAQIGTTGIILADESLLMPALQTIPENTDLNVTMGFALSGSSVYGLADLWLNSQLELEKDNHISYQTLEAFITHPLTGLSVAMKDNVQSALLKENIVNIDLKRLLKQGGIFGKFYQKIENPKDLVAGLLDVLRFVLSRLSSKNSLKKIDADLFVKTINELTRLNDTLKQFVENEKFHFVVQLIQKSLQGVAVPLSGDPLNGIQLMGLLEARNLNFEHVIFLGFNEGVIPKSSAGNSFIPDNIRRVHGLPVLENLDAIFAYLVYRLIQRASRVSLVYNNLTTETSTGEPSRFLKQLEHESGLKFNYHDLHVPVQTEEKKVIRIDKSNPKIQAELQKYLRKEKSLSPSSITTYIANPVDFYFKNIAGIKEPQEVTAVIEANEVGSILHKAMEAFYQPFVGKEVSREAISERRNFIKPLIKKAFCDVRKQPNAEAYEFSGMQEVVLAIVEEYVSIILERDITESPFKIVSLEQKINAEIAFEAFGVPQSIQIFGIIDRVDQKNGITRIIDYKTGNDKLKCKTVEELFNTNGKYLNKALVQTLIYKYAVEQQSGLTNVEPILYVVRTMSDIKDGGVHFKIGTEVLQHDKLESFYGEFKTQLREKLQGLFEDPYFEVSENAENFKYSIYQELFVG